MSPENELAQTQNESVVKQIKPENVRIPGRVLGSTKRPLITLMVKTNDSGRVQPIEFMIDTGAQLSVISPAATQRLGIDPSSLGHQITLGWLGVEDALKVREVNASIWFQGFKTDLENRQKVVLLNTQNSIWIPRRGDWNIEEQPSILGRDIMNQFSLHLNLGDEVVYLEVPPGLNEAFLAYELLEEKASKTTKRKIKRIKDFYKSTRASILN